MEELHKPDFGEGNDWFYNKDIDVRDIPLKIFSANNPRLFPERELERADALARTTIGDVLDSQYQSSCKRIRAFALEHTEDLKKWYSYFADRQVLPKKSDKMGETPGDILELFFADFVKWVDYVLCLYRNNPAKQFSKTNIDTAKALKKIFVDGISYQDTGYDLRFTNSQSVRNLVDPFIDAFRNILQKNVFSDRYVRFDIDSRLKSCLQSFSRESIICRPSDRIKSKLDIHNDNLVLFVLRLFECDIYKKGTMQNFLKEDFVVPSGKIGEMEDSLLIARDFLDERVENVRESEVFNFIVRKHVNRDIASMVIEIMKNSIDFIHIQDEDGICYFTLSWDQYSGVEERMARIVYESVDKAMKKEDVIIEYRKRCVRFGMEFSDTVSFQRPSKKISAPRGGGMWKWKDGKCTNARQAVREFVAKHEEAFTLSEVMDYLESLNVSANSSSVETYLNETCRRAENGSDVWIRKTDPSVSTRADLSKDVVRLLKTNGKKTIADIAQNLDVLQNRVRRVIQNYPDVFVSNVVANPGKGQGRLMEYGINPLWDGRFDVRNNADRRPGYYDLVIQYAVRYLKNALDWTCDESPLVNSLLFLVPDIVKGKANAIYKILKKDNNFNIKAVSGNRNEITLNPTIHRQTAPVFNLENDWNSIKKGLVRLAVKEKWYNESRTRYLADNMKKIMGNGGQIHRDNHFWLVLEMFHEYLNGENMSLNNMEYMRQLVSLAYERFLRNLYRCQGKGDLLADPGLGKVIFAMSFKGRNYLDIRNNPYWKDILDCMISCRGSVAHPNMRPSKAEIVHDIKVFILLYLESSRFV